MRLWVAVFLPWAFATAETAPTGQGSTTLRSTTRLVQVSVIVHERNGQPVEGLRKQDFEVFERGQKQSIAVFAVQRDSDSIRRARPMPPNAFTNRPEFNGDIPPTVTAVLLDALNMQWLDLARARQHVIRFLKQLQPADRIAIYTLGRKLRILHDYTTDVSGLLRALAAYEAESTSQLHASDNDITASILKDFGRDVDVSALDPWIEKADSTEASLVARTAGLTTLAALRSIGNHLAALPGRKNLIWITGGFRMMTDATSPSSRYAQLISDLNHANVAVYPTDARGVFPPSGTGWDVGQSAMYWVAENTGGRPFFSSNDVTWSIRKTIEDSRITYLLGYYSTEAPDGKYHDIKVNVDRRGVDVRHRRGYFAELDRRSDQRSRKTELRVAIHSPLEATTLELAARVQPQDGNTIELTLQVSPRNISVRQIGGRRIGEADVVIAQLSSQGYVVSDGTETLQVELDDREWAQVQEKGLVYRANLKCDPKASSLRVVVRDTMSGATGSLSIPFSKIVRF